MCVADVTEGPRKRQRLMGFIRMRDDASALRGVEDLGRMEAANALAAIC